MEQFNIIRREFNKLGSRWVTTGSMAASMHASQMGVTIRKPKNFDFMIAKKNRDKFADVLVKLGYEFITFKSSRNNLRFEKTNNFPVNLLLTESQSALNHVSYNSTPIQSLKTLLNQKHAQNKNSANIANLRKILNKKQSLHTMVHNLMNGINMSVN